MEAIGIKVKGLKKNCNIVGVYRRSEKRVPKQVWQNLVKEISKKEHWMIAGDFNAHNVVWNCRDTVVNTSNLHEIMEERGMYIVNENTMIWVGDGTRRESNLDLCFASEEIIEGIKYRKKKKIVGVVITYQ